MVKNYINFNRLNLHITEVSIAKPSPACATAAQQGPAEPIRVVSFVDSSDSRVFTLIMLRIDARVTGVDKVLCCNLMYIIRYAYLPKLSPALRCRILRHFLS